MADNIFPCNLIPIKVSIPSMTAELLRSAMFLCSTAWRYCHAKSGWLPFHMPDKRPNRPGAPVCRLIASNIANWGVIFLKLVGSISQLFALTKAYCLKYNSAIVIR